MNPWILTVYLTAFAADAGTTAAAVSQPGIREAALPSQSALVLVGITAAEAGLGYWAYGKLKPQHPKTATVVWIALTAAHGSAAAWNAKQLRGGR